MSTTDSIFKDILEVHGRILEHRPVVQGDINFFIREFEEKYKGQDFTRLKMVDDGLTKISETDFPGCQKTLEENGQNILSKLKKAVEMCDRIAQREGTIETESLRVQREFRAVEWAEFMKTQFEKSAQVDQEFEQQKEALIKHYEDLEEKLKLATP